MIRLAKQYGRYGYCKVTAFLRMQGWRVNHKQIECLWGQEGPQLPHRHKKRRRLYHQNSSVIRLQPTHSNYIWTIDFIDDKLSNGRSYRMLTVLNEYTRKALCVAVRPKMNAHDVLDALNLLLIKRDKPECIRSDNGSEFIAAHFQDWLKRVGIQPLLIYQGSLWENGYNERFNRTLRQKVLNAEWFHTTKKAQLSINACLRQYNQIRPHHALGMRPPVPEILLEKTKISGIEKGG